MAGTPANDASPRIIDEVSFGADVTVAPFTNLYGCTIGDRTRVGPFVEIQAGAVIGSDCKIQSHSFICDGVTIEDEVFVGHGVVFVNDNSPRATTDSGDLAEEGDWELSPVTVRRGAAIGSGAVILGGMEIGERATVGAGAVVVNDVPPEVIVVGNPARELSPGSRKSD